MTDLTHELALATGLVACTVAIHLFGLDLLMRLTRLAGPRAAALRRCRVGRPPRLASAAEVSQPVGADQPADEAAGAAARASLSPRFSGSRSRPPSGTNSRLTELMQ